MASRLALWIKRRISKYFFKIAAIAPILDFRSVRILTLFDPQVTLILPPKLHVNWPKGSGEKVQNKI